MSRRNRIITRVTVPIAVLGIGIALILVMWDTFGPFLLVTLPFEVATAIILSTVCTPPDDGTGRPIEFVDDGSWHIHQEEIGESDQAALIGSALKGLAGGTDGEAS